MLAPITEDPVLSARPDPAMPMSVRGLTVAYGDARVLSDASLDIPTGSMTAIIGPNGAASRRCSAPPSIWCRGWPAR